MPTQQTQDFSNHTRWSPGYHFFTSPLTIAYFIWAVTRVVNNPSADHWFNLVGALALLGVVAFVRVNPLRAQDRVIRLEEQLRMARVLPADLQSHIASINPRQLVALRFASDAELPDIVRMIVANPAIKPTEIKKAITNWRPDHFRV